MRLATLESNFKIPFHRDLLLSLGVISASETSINNFLGSKEKSRAIVLVVGGAAEALDSFPGTNVLTLRNRFGFIKCALKTGSSLVPVFSFGETDLYDQIPNPPGSKLRQWQDWAKSKLGFSTPFFHGRGVFNYKYGFLPHRTPVLSLIFIIFFFFLFSFLFSSHFSSLLFSSHLFSSHFSKRLILLLEDQSICHTFQIQQRKKSKNTTTCT